MRRNHLISGTVPVLVALSFGIAAPPVLAQASGRVVGGHDAQVGKYPFQTYLLIAGTYACGATLIAPNWLLTAAHCTEDPHTHAQFPASAYKARIAPRIKNEGGESHSVVRVIVHEGFNTPIKLTNDIALLELDHASNLPPVALEGVLAPISEIGSQQKSEQVRLSIEPKASPWARVIGWGYMNVNANFVTPEVLQEAELPIVSQNVCNRDLPTELEDAGPIDERRICAGLGQGGVDSCNGDSGGPLLVAAKGGGDVQVGIVSYGVEKCGSPKAYGIYTRVAAFAPWIERNLHVVSDRPHPTATAALDLGKPSAAPSLIAAAEKGDAGLTAEVMPGGKLAVGDVMKVRIHSPVDGYVAVFDVKADNSVVQVFPNARSDLGGKTGRLRGGEPLVLPDPSYGFEMSADLPVGRSRLLVVVAKDKADLMSAVRLSEGLKSMADGDKTFERLEVVARAKPSKIFAAFADYVVTEH